MEEKVKEHYGSDDLVKKIEAALLKAGKDLSRLEIKELFPVDQLHTGGVKAGAELFHKSALKPGDHVLDAGCGIGGSSRLLAKEFNCRVTGLDLSDRFILCAEFLTSCTGLEDRIKFRQGSVIDLPFEDCIFDAVLCQHLLMNVENKTAAVKEFFRVLKPGGKLILHEITKGTGRDIRYPVPWASEAGISFLESWENLATILQKSDFKPYFIEDRSETALLWWKKAGKAREKQPAMPPNVLGPALVFGENARFFAKNMQHNFQNNSICLIEALFCKD